MKPKSAVPLNRQILDEASAWFVDFRVGDVDAPARERFDQWLRVSPEHIRAYMEIAKTYVELPTLKSNNRIDIDALIDFGSHGSADGRGGPEIAFLEVAAIGNEEPALDPIRKSDVDTLIPQAREDASKVVPQSAGSAFSEPQEFVRHPPAVASHARHGWLFPPGKKDKSPRSPPGEGSGRRRKLVALTASLAALTLLGGLWSWLFSGVYSTAIGEQRSIGLADGSTVELNSKSRIRVRSSKSERAVDLLEGQALFQVAKDATRPFIVRADGTRVRAVGTQFDVYEKRSGTVVTVVEGEVAVLMPAKGGVRARADGSATPNDIPVATISVAAGEQLTLTPKVALKSEHANVAAATAWTERRIVFESNTLWEVAEEYNRYNERQLIIEDPGLDFHISGVFSSTDPDSLIRFLRERPGVKVSETSSEIRITKSS
jgi:ferric-dicitrate binding protein FerR (iron transport regulator)